MNKNNIEVELRYRVKNKKNILNWLNENAKKLYEYHQVDEYFTPKHKNYFDEKIPREYLRIRDSDGKFSIAYKYWYSTEKGEGTHCDEYETDVEDGVQIKRIFKALDFKTLVVVDKYRVVYEYKDFEISVDDEKVVGVVCEIEIKKNYKDTDEAQGKIREFAKKLGLSESDRTEDVKLGYAFLIATKKGIIKR
jgi:adenylate cyclase class 2